MFSCFKAAHRRLRACVKGQGRCDWAAKSLTNLNHTHLTSTSSVFVFFVCFFKDGSRYKYTPIHATTPELSSFLEMNFLLETDSRAVL